MSRRLREIAEPFVAAVPAGARVRTRLRVSPRDAEVLRAAGRHLGMLAGRDLAARGAEGRLDARGRAESRRERKQALTAASSSRWAGAITRTSEDAWQLASRNLVAERATLKASPVIAADVNAGYLAVAVAAPDGNVLGAPFTIPLELAGLPATARDGRIRAAVTQLIATAKTAGARTVVIEDLDFKEARAEGRERTGKPALTRQARARLPAAHRGHSHRPPPGSKTGRPHRTTAGNQAAEDRSQPPAEPIPTTARC